jgi:hypothetical protein
MARTTLCHGARQSPSGSRFLNLTSVVDDNYTLQVRAGGEKSGAPPRVAVPQIALSLVAAVLAGLIS